MKILTVSDHVEPSLYEQFQSGRFPGINLILACGDLPPEYLTFLVTSFNVPLFYVRGNHDIRPDGYRPEGCIDLDGRLVQYGGLNIMGLEGSHWYHGNPHQYTERQMQHKIDRMSLKIWRQKGVDIIITHAPPRHIHDGEDQCHRGFECFRQLIDRYTPQYFIHGHMHFNYTTPAQRITVVKKTKVVNSYGYYIFKIDDGRPTE